MKSKRSASHPTYTIEHCLELTGQIYQNFGSSLYASRSDLGQALNKSAGHIQQQVSSCTQYGLLDLKTGEGYKVSDLYIQYHRPLDEKQKRDALMTAFKSPTIHAALIEQFNDDVLPNQKVLSNILFQHYRISETACEKAASVFYSNVEFMGVLRDGNILKLSEVTPTEPYDETDQARSDSSQVVLFQGSQNNYTRSEQSNDNHRRVKEKIIEPEIHSQSYSNSDDNIPFNVPLKGRRTAQIIIPNDCKASDFDTLINWIRLMKESFE